MAVKQLLFKGLRRCQANPTGRWERKKMTKPESNIRESIGPLEELAKSILPDDFRSRLRRYMEERDSLLAKMIKKGGLDGGQSLPREMTVKLMRECGIYMAFKR